MQIINSNYFKFCQIILPTNVVNKTNQGHFRRMYCMPFPQIIATIKAVNHPAINGHGGNIQILSHTCPLHKSNMER